MVLSLSASSYNLQHKDANWCQRTPNLFCLMTQHPFSWEKSPPLQFSKWCHLERYNFRDQQSKETESKCFRQRWKRDFRKREVLPNPMEPKIHWHPHLEGGCESDLLTAWLSGIAGNGVASSPPYIVCPPRLPPVSTPKSFLRLRSIPPPGIVITWMFCDWWFELKGYKQKPQDGRNI